MQVKISHTLPFKAMTLAAILLMCLVSCSDIYDEGFYINTSYPEYKQPENSSLAETPNNRRVFVLFSFGYNNLSYDLHEDIRDMVSGKLPGYGFEENVVLVLRQGTAKGSNYSLPSSPVLTHVYSKGEEIIHDTLKVYSDTTVAARKSMVNEVLTLAKERFPSKSYGVLFSSHGTGWAPQGYCYSPPDKNNSTIFGLNTSQYEGPAKYHESRPLLKSIGAHYNGSASRSIEINIPDLADAIPMHLDYILFDACFMGGVEVAYELKDKCDKICFSQTEVLSGGMDYKNLLSVLFDENGTDITTCAENYFDMYKDQKASYMRSATVSVVDCRKLEPLAEIVAKHASAIKTLANSNARASVQGYFQPRYSRYHGIFYDLEDIIKKSGASEDEMRELTDALNACILCKFATKSFLDEFNINTHCGLSMYLPDSDREILNEYYTSLKWEKTTRLID
jgi:hypothetical protein